MIITNVREKLITFFLIVLSIFPFGLGSLVAINYFKNYHFFRIEFLLMLLFFIFILTVLFHVGSTISIKESLLVVIILVAAISVRWLAIIFFNTQPTSDFLNAIRSATNHMTGPIKDLQSARFPYWGFYILTLASIFKLFGASLTILKIINAIISGLTSVGIFFLGKKMFDNKLFGFIASVIYIFWPADILYKSLPTGEHIFALLFPLACIVFIYGTVSCDKHIIKSPLVLLSTGILLGLMDMYKPVAIVLLISFVIVIFLYKIFSSNYGTRFYSDKYFWTNFILIIVMLFGYWITKEACYALLRYETMFTPNRYGSIPTLRVGLDPKYEGKWDKEISVYVRNLWTEYNEDYQFVNSILSAETKEIIRENKFSLLYLFKTKFTYAWSSENAFYQWTTAQQIDNGFTSFDPKILGAYIKPWEDAYLIITLVFSTIGSIYYALYKRNELSFSIGLFIFGFAALLLLTEVQQRYRSVLVSSIPIFIASGVYAINQISVFIRHRIKNQ